MQQQISIELFKSELLECLDETFERHHGIYLDRNTSLFKTLDNISAAEASRSIVANGATVAAHVEHAGFYLDVLGEAMRTKTNVQVNWREIWERVRAVSPEEWDASKQKLQQSYRRMVETIENYDSWENKYGLSAAFAILAHTAYHLGAIRQAITVIKAARNQD